MALQFPIIAAISAAVLAVGAGGYLVVANQTPVDQGAGTQSSIEDGTTVPKNEQMSPVSQEEANRRATVNQEAAQRALEQKRDYQAPTVITDVGPADKGEAPPAFNTEAPKPVERVIKETTERTIYVNRVPVEQPVDDKDFREALAAQILSVTNPSNGGQAASRPQTAVRFYAAPAPEAKPAAATASSGSRQSPAAPAQRIVARTGDVIFGRLDRGFNSDDPGAPIIVTLDDVIYDPATGGTRNGPLTGARLVGQIQYSQHQSAINFNQLVTVDGSQYSITAIAISEQSARTGIATKVDKHTLERYSGLLAASLLQGAGQVASQLVSNNRTVTVADGVVTSAANAVNYGEVAVAALQPLGANLANIAQQKFARPATMSAAAGTGVGVVFLGPVMLPKGTK